MPFGDGWPTGVMPDPYHEFAEATITKAREALEGLGQLPPISYFTSTYPGQRGMHIVDCTQGMRNDATKNALAAFLRKSAKKWKATFHLHVSEAWTIPDDPEVGKRMVAERKTPSQMPERIEVVWAFAEVPGQQYFCQVPITRDAEGRPSFGVVLWREVPAGELVGRFAAVLPMNDHLNQIPADTWARADQEFRDMVDYTGARVEGRDNG